MTKYKDTPCPICGRKKVRPSKRFCSGCETRVDRGKTGETLKKPFVEKKPATPRDPDALLGQPDLSSQIRADRESASLRAQIELYKRKYLEAIKMANTQEQILEFNRMAVSAIPPVNPPDPPDLSKHKTVESAVLVGSCWHIGETINKEEMGGLNEYDFDVFVKRFQFLIEKTISFTLENMSNHTFEELRVLLTGDMVSGIIHELEESNCLNIVEQAHLGALVTAQGILDLARRFPRVIVTCVAGNHGRVKEKKYFKHKQMVNWDYVFYETLALLLKNQKNVTFQIPLCNWAGVEIQGFNFFVNHGDSIKSWGGIPFYGLNREAGKWMEIHASSNKFFQYFVTSHFHTRALLQSAVGEKIMNGSLKGGCEYAIGNTLYSPPSQLLFGVHKRHGKTWELPINPARATSIQVRYKYNRTKDLSSQLEVI